MNNTKIHPKLKLYFETDEIFFGPGNAEFLSLIDSLGSIQAACSAMNMSYSKGWKMIKHMECKTNTVLVVRVSGGNRGGSSHLSEDGKHLLHLYHQLYDQLNQTSQKLMETYDDQNA